MAVFLLDCPHCPATNSTFTILSERVVGKSWRVFAACGGCGDSIMAKLPWIGNGRHPMQVSGNIRNDGFRLEKTWPARKPPEAPPFTPNAVAARFRDGEFNFQNGRWNAAVGMYRAALDLATKELSAEGSTFFKRMGWLASNHRITADIRAWADHVRVEGNDALHDPVEFTKTDAEPLRHFTEMFLRYVFEMPGLVAEFRTAQEEAKAAESESVS